MSGYPATHIMDPVALLFRRLPGPDALEEFFWNGSLKAWGYIDNCFLDFRMASRTQKSKDPDQDFLVEVSGKCISVGTSFRFHFALGKLAVERDSKSTSVDTSLKGVHMRYAKWMIRGRREDEWLDIFDAAQLVPPVSYANIPRRYYPLTPCLVCGHVRMLECASCIAAPKCGAVCRLSHGDYHLLKWNCPDPTCRDIERITRAASVFQPLFLALNDCGSLSYAKEIRSDEQSITLISDAGQRFHETLLPQEKLTKTIKDAISLSGWCWEVLTTAKPLFDLLVTPLCSKVEEVDFVIKNVHRPVITQLPHKTLFNSDSRHIVVKLTMRSGLELAFDPTGIQFGWEQIITPWSAYVRHRVVFITHQREVCEGRRRSEPHDDLRHSLQHWATQALKEEATLWAVDTMRQSVRQAADNDVLPLLDAGWEQWKKWRTTLEAQGKDRIEWMIHGDRVTDTMKAWQREAREQRVDVSSYLRWSDILALFPPEPTHDETAWENLA